MTREDKTKKGGIEVRNLKTQEDVPDSRGKTLRGRDLERQRGVIT